MVKLQLYITKSLRGYKSLINLNPSEEIVRHIHDVRSALEVVNYDPSEKHIFYLIRYIDEGTILTILRTIPINPLNHLAATIFIPNGAIISADNLMQVVKLTTRKVSGAGVTADDIAELRAMFDREYSEYGERPGIASSEGRAYAVCNYGGDTGRQLSDFLGSRLFQPTFTAYAGVLLIDSDLGLPTTCTDLSDMQLRETVSIVPPKTTDEGFAPHIYGKPFNHAYLVPIGESFTITWTRQGFEAVSKDFTLTDEMLTIDAPDTSLSRKAISPATFYITSRVRRTPLTNCKIVVNDVEITEAHSFTYSELIEAQVTISCHGYSTFSGIIDLASTAQALVSLRDQRKVYRFEMPLKGGEYGSPISFELHSRRPITESPIDGYESKESIREGSNVTNQLNFIAGHNSGGRHLGWVIALIVGLVVGVAAGAYFSDDILDYTLSQPATAEAHQDTVAASAVATVSDKIASASQKADEPMVTDTVPEPIVNDAIKYLESNRNWKRDELEAFTETAGLFDDMNDFQLENIINKWEPALKGSKSFAKVATAARHAISKNKNPKRERHNPTYNAANDSVIGWLGYCNWIDP